jgi:hypothetical protein
MQWPALLVGQEAQTCPAPGGSCTSSAHCCGGIHGRQIIDTSGQRESRETAASGSIHPKVTSHALLRH